MFTTEHFIWMGICLVLISVLTFVSIKFKFSFKTSALIMAVVSLLSEISKIFSHMEFVNGEDAADGMVIDPGALPLHLCSILIFAFFYLPFAKDGKPKSYILSLAVPVSLIGSLLAIVMATSGTDFTTSNAYQCFIYHATMIWFAIYLIATKQVDLGKRAWVTNMISLFALSVIMIWVNGALQEYDTNFLYVVRPPADGLPLLNLDNGWYAYYATMLGCGFVGLCAVHLPFVIGENKVKSKKQE